MSILTGRRAAWVPDSDTGGWQESLTFSIPELTIASKDKRVGTAIHSGQRKRLEPGSADSQMANNKIKTAQAVMPG